MLRDPCPERPMSVPAISGRLVGVSTFRPWGRAEDATAAPHGGACLRLVLFGTLPVSQPQGTGRTRRRGGCRWEGRGQRGPGGRKERGSEQRVAQSGTSWPAFAVPCAGMAKAPRQEAGSCSGLCCTLFGGM